MKTSKRILALVLSALMIFSVVIIPGADLSMFGFEADAAVTLGGITQQRVVDNYEALYRSYQKRFFAGEETNWPTNFVIPGLGNDDDYTPQGMTYWKAKEWILISAYDAGGSDPTVIYALDAVTTEFVALFKIYKDAAYTDANTSHGGGIAASEYNFYFADDGSNISYIPLSEMDVAKGTVKNIHPWGSIDCSGELTSLDGKCIAKTSYCCYDDGILWAGNFYFSEDDRYTNYAYNNNDLQSMLMGYKLAGNSSAEEWYYLKHGYNLVKLNKDSATENQTSGTATYRTYNVGGANVEIRGNIATATKLDEVTVNFCSVDLTAGKTYKVEYIADNNLTDMYMFAPKDAGGTHCNVKQSQQSKITDLGNGKYHYQMIFTAGLKPAGADSTWPTTTPVDSKYTGTYTMRFDQDSVPADGREFNITDFSVSEYNNPTFTPDAKYEGIGCAGNPTYVVGLSNIDRVQYAMVDKGKIYISRSWSRTESTNHVRELIIGDMDIYSPGNTTLTINGRERRCHTLTSTLNRFGGGSGDAGRTKMLYMGEALCVIEDYLYMFGESAAYTYRAKEGSKCPEPIDVIWKIDQYAIQGLPRPHEDVTAVEYEKVNSLSEINNQDEYIIVHESPIKDPVTQDNILYLLDAYGGYGDKKLPKKANASEISEASTGDSIGVIGYEIRDYSVKEENGKISLILNAEDDANKSLHWQIESGSSTTLKLKNRDLYFAKHPYFYSGDKLFAMTSTAHSAMKISEEGNGKFGLWGGTSERQYGIWCNDGELTEAIPIYSNYYANHTATSYTSAYHGLEEIPGTFHVNVGANIADLPIWATYAQTYFQIYKRVSDPYASTYETQVYTNLDAELTADGTYNVTLETYATNNLQYQRVANRPTDFIFVLDVSGSMDEPDVNAYVTSSNWDPIKLSQLVNSDTTSDNKGVGVNGINLRNGTNDFYYKTGDGNYHPIYAAVRTTVFEKNWLGITTNFNQNYWVYFINVNDGLYYLLKKDGSVATTGITRDQLETKITNNTDITTNSTATANKSRQNTEVFSGTYYESKYDYMRIDAIKTAVDSLSYKIALKAAEDKLDHRIALVSFGSDGEYDSSYKWSGTGMYTNSGSWVSYPNITPTNYQNAFFSVSQFGTLRNTLNQLKPEGHTFPSYGLEMASNIIDNSAYQYDVNGTRNAVVIVISDGVPGNDNQQDKNLDTTKAIANSTLAGGAYSIKRNGAYVYSVLVGNATENNYGFADTQFDDRDFMKYLSSEYTGARSMADPGPHNDKENVNYYIQVPAGNDFNLNALVNQVFNDSVANAPYATASLTGDAVLRERLSSAFDLSNATYTYQTAKSKYDGIGRLYFDTPTTATGIKTNVLEETVADGSIERIVEVTGFDYSAKNVSEYNSKAGNGEKLIVTISGVVARHDRELNNTSINNTDETALYQNETFKNSNQPVKRFPIFHFSIPEYTYILDYGLKMYDNDINGTLLSVDSLPQKQTGYKTELNTNDMGIKFENSNLDMTYSVKPYSTGTEETSRGYCLIQRDDGTYDWFRINVLPASNVYFEESAIELPTGSKWSVVGTDNGKYQALTSPDDVYGYDAMHEGEYGFSHGAAYTTTVTSDPSNMRSDTLSFDYTGNAIDIVASCGTDTGIYIVTIKNGSTVEKAYIVDSYFSDSAVLNGAQRINQVPIVHHENAGGHGTYKAEVTSVYLSSIVGGRTTYAMNRFGNEDMTFFSRDITEEAKEAILQFAEMEYLLDADVEVVFCDENSVLNGGTGVEGASGGMATFGLRGAAPAATTKLTNYFDGFRTYNPLDRATGEYPESEQQPTYYNVINDVVDLQLGQTENLSNFVYVEGGTPDTVDFTTYRQIGPKNEVYLTPKGETTEGIAFLVGYNDKTTYALGLRSINGKATLKVNNREITIDSATEMYYDITEIIRNTDYFADGLKLITLTNTGTTADGTNNLIAVNQLKCCDGAPVRMMMSALPRIRMMMAAPAEEVEPNAPEEEEIPDIPAPEAPPVVEPLPEEPSTTPDGDTGTEEEKDFIEQITENFTKLLNMIQSMLERIVNLLKSLMA